VAFDVRHKIVRPKEQPSADPNAADLAALAEPEQRRARDAAQRCTRRILGQQ